MICKWPAIINPLLSMFARFFRGLGSCALRARSVACGASLFAVLIVAAPARADIQKPPRARAPGERSVQRASGPPSAADVRVKVPLGGRVEITLQAHGQFGKSIDFLIRTPPAHGTLEGPPRHLSRNTASVTYLHRDADGPGGDTFTYAVQAPAGGVSAEATVSVEVTDAPPSLTIMPAELDFGAVTAGQSSRAQLVLENHGGSEAAGRLMPPEPWSVEGSADYRLGRGQSQTFDIVFQPRLEKVFAETVHFRDEQGGGLRLVGTGLPGVGQPETAVPAAAIAAARGGSSEAPAAPPATEPAANAAASSTPPARTAAAADPLSAVTPANNATGQQGSVTPPSDDTTSISRNEAGVTAFTVRNRGRTTIELAWKAPTPRPKSYRVEMRDLTTGPDDKPIVDWRPYPLVDVHADKELVTATLRGLDAGTRETLRIVAVDDQGRLADPSPMLMVDTLPPATWWRPTPLKVLFGLLLICGAFVIRRRLEERRLLAEIASDRENDPAAMYR